MNRWMMNQNKKKEGKKYIYNLDLWVLNHYSHEMIGNILVNIPEMKIMCEGWFSGMTLPSEHALGEDSFRIRKNRPAPYYQWD